jgi:hypothetical protein
VIDFEGMTPRDLDQLLTVTKAIADSVRAHGVTTVVIAVPAGDTAAYPAALLLQSADLIMPVLYDQHWATSPPGPIGGRLGLAQSRNASRRGRGGKDRRRVSPVGYRWRRSARRSNQLRRCASSHDDNQHAASPRPRVGNASRGVAGGWEIWVSDRVLVETLVRGSERTGSHQFCSMAVGTRGPSRLELHRQLGDQQLFLVIGRRD